MDEIKNDITLLKYIYMKKANDYAISLNTQF